MRVRQLEQDRFEYELRVFQRVAIPEADHSPASSVQMRSSASIRLNFGSMLSTVELDDEATLYAREIRDVRADRMLRSESVPSQASVANMKPQPKLRVGHGPSQHTCAIAGPHPPMLGRMRTSCEGTEG